VRRAGPVLVGAVVGLALTSAASAASPAGSETFEYLTINDRGQIVGARGTGETFHGNRVIHAVLWTPKPGCVLGCAAG